MSGNSPASQTGSPPPSRRNPVEQMIVRGFIGVLLVLVAVEAYPWYTHKKAMDTLQSKIKAVDELPDSPAVRETDVKRAMAGKQPTSSEELKGRLSNGASRLEIYDWFTLNPFNKRQLYVYYGHTGTNDAEGPEVLEVQPDAEIAQPAKPRELSAEELAAYEKSTEGSRMPPAGMGMGGPPGGRGGAPGGRGGPPGGRGGPPAHDADGKPDPEKSPDDKPSDATPNDAEPDDSTKKDQP